jgi:hypothetical protein
VEDFTATNTHIFTYTRVKKALSSFLCRTIIGEHGEAEGLGANKRERNALFAKKFQFRKKSPKSSRVIVAVDSLQS